MKLYDDTIGGKKQSIIENLYGKLLFKYIKYLEKEYKKGFDSCFTVSSYDDGDVNEILVFIDCVEERDNFDYDNDYFEYLRMFEREVKRFIDYLDSKLMNEIFLIDNWYDIHEHYRNGEELYYSCGLICRIIGE